MLGDHHVKMAWCCLFLGVPGVALGFQLRVPPALQPKMPLAPRRVNTSKQWPGSRVTSSTMKEGEATAAGPVQAQEGSTHEEEPFDWAKQVRGTRYFYILISVRAFIPCVFCLPSIVSEMQYFQTRYCLQFTRLRGDDAFLAKTKITRSWASQKTDSVFKSSSATAVTR